MDINRQAPAYHHTDLFIDAPADLVYSILTQIEYWPKWQAGVRIISPPDEILPGAGFKWTDGGMQISSRIIQTDAPCRLEWQSRSMWIRACVRWDIEEEAEGALVHFEQSIEGFGAILMQTALTKSMEVTLLELKKYAEMMAVPA